MEDDQEWSVQVSTSSKPVDNAVSTIEELANSLIRTVDYTEGLEENFQELASSLVELETDRLRLHNELEIQTINASIKRHSLKTCPAEFQRELEDAVLAARNGNAATTELLQSQMKRATEETKLAIQKHEMLQLDNFKFIPERELVTKQHDEIIAALNQRMADKASKQIKLNETRDLLRDASGGTEEYDLGIKNLKEDMDVFRTNSEAEQKQLETEVAQKQEAIALQDQKNMDEKRTVSQLQDKIMDMTGRLDVVRKDVKRTENSKARLEMQSIQLRGTIDREKLINKQTAEEVTVLEASRDNKKMWYEEKIQEAEVKMKQVHAQLEDVMKKHKDLVKEKDENFLKKEEVVRQKLKTQASVREAAREVQVIKRKTTTTIEKAAQVSQENTQAQEDLLTLAENHSATAETFNMQILEYQSNLDMETTEKRNAQEGQEETQKVLDEFKTKQIRFMNDMTLKIEERRKQHRILAKQSSEFNKYVAGNKKKLGILRVELEMAEKGLETMKQELAMEIERLKISIELYETENVKKLQSLEDKEPVLKNLEIDLEQTEQDYSKFKTEVVVIRNKQKSVQEKINRSQGMLDKLTKPHERLKANSKTCRSDTIGQLKISAAERNKYEAEIYDRTQKLESLLNENEKFASSIAARVKDIDEISADIKRNGEKQQGNVEELLQLQRKFMMLWDICIVMEKESAEHDAQVLLGIDELKQETKGRSVVLTGISGKLCAEMERLTGFLDNVNSRRPKDTRQEMRNPSQPTPPLGATSSHHRKSSTPFSSQSRRKLTLPSTPSHVVCYE